MRLRKALPAETILAVSAAASAQPVTGICSSVGAGASWFARIPRSEIAVSAHSETRPLVPTADGVREPQNRLSESP
jgi:pantothenate kinase